MPNEMIQDFTLWDFLDVNVRADKEGRMNKQGDDFIS